MKQSVSEYTFTEAFRKIRPDNFSYAGLKAMFDYFEQMEEDTGEEMELDVIAICCEWTEYDSAAEACAECVTGWGTPEREEAESDEDYAERVQEEALKELRDATRTIEDYDGEKVIMLQF